MPGKGDSRSRMANKKELELYLHIPFCVKKCAYCDFLSQPGDDKLIEDYISHLLREIEQEAEDKSDRVITTVFFGGGTPSILPAGKIDDLLEALRKHFTFAEDPEITLECNPGTLTKEKLAIYKNAGVNRLSMGVQSANDRELSMLGRIHVFADVIENYDAARNTGFKNIGMDLIFGLPQQRKDTFLQSVKKVVQFRPDHLSLYSLQIEEGTKFFALYGVDEETRRQGGLPMLLPTEEAERSMYHGAMEFLQSKGYERYEISNFCRKGFACRHNLGYWKRKDYLGLGLGAASLMGRKRFHKTNDLSSYLKGDFSVQEETALTRRDEMAEMMFLGLRLTEGVSFAEFHDAFGVSLKRTYEEPIARLTDQGLLIVNSERIYLSEKGFDLANQAMSEFIL